MRLFTVLAVSALTFSVVTARPSENPVGILRFADSLADEGDFYRAITEYKRAMFYFPEYEKIDHIKLQIGRAYYLGGRYALAKQYLVPLTAHENDNLRFFSYNFLGLSYFENEEYFNSERVFRKLAREEQSLINRTDYYSYLGMSLMGLKRFHNAADVFSENREQTENKEYRAFLDNASSLADKASGYERKSPGWAITWGILFPGGGHIYLGEYDDALVSFLVVATTGYLAYDGFARESAVQSGIFLALSSGFYAGSIYSAYRETKRHNLTLGDAEIELVQKQFRKLNLRISRRFQFN